MTQTAQKLHNLNTISHDGKVLVFGMNSAGQLYYTVRQSGFEDTALSDDNTGPEGFEEWKLLRLGESAPDASVSEYEAKELSDNSGNALLRSLFGDGDATVKSAPAKVQLVSGMRHLYLFRLSAGNTLVVNRFILDGMTNELIPKLDVRFRRSREKLRPDEGKGSGNTGGVSTDSLDFRDMDDQPFYEPALELSFIRNLNAAAPWFSPILLNTSEHEQFRWNIFVYDAVLKSIVLYSVRASADGLFDLKDAVRIQPDPSNPDRKIMRMLPGIVQRKIDLQGMTVTGGFSATVYNNQVEQSTKAGMQLLKDATRVMLAVPVQTGGASPVSTAAVSFAAVNDGTLSRIDLTPDESRMLRGKVKEILLPVDTLDEIKLIADTTPLPTGTIRKMSMGDDELLRIQSAETVVGLETGQEVTLTGTKSYDGSYTVKNVTEAGFEIEAEFNRDEPGFWEAVETEQDGLVFDNMVVAYEKTDEGLLKVQCTSHNLQEGDEVQISGTANMDGRYPVRSVGEDNSFLLDVDWQAGEAANLSAVKRRGICFDGEGDYILTGNFPLSAPKARNPLGRTVSGWVRPEGDAGKSQIILLQEDGGLSLRMNEAGNAVFEVKMTDGSSMAVTDPEPLTPDCWTHLAGVVSYDPDAGGRIACSLCRNGVRVPVSEADAVDSTRVIEPDAPFHLSANFLKFDGQNDYLAVDKLHYTKAGEIPAITVEAWVRTAKEKEAIIASWDRSDYWRLSVNGTVLWCTADESKNIDDFTGRRHVADGKWHHIAVTYNAETGLKQIFVDGEMDVAKEAHGKRKLGTGNKRYGFLGVGSEADRFNGKRGPLNYFEGNMADVRIWNYAREQADICDNRYRLLTGLETGLTAWWLLESKNENRQADSAPAKQYARIFGAPVWETVTFRHPGVKAAGDDETFTPRFTIGGKSDSEGFKGKISDVQIWNAARTPTEIKDTMHIRLLGNEMNLAGLWRLGGIVNDGERRYTPDFSVNAADADLFGDAYVSAVELSRSSGLGKAAMYRNDDLFAVSQGAAYRESFEFRVFRPDGEMLSLEELEDIDGSGRKIFQFSYWGRKSRTDTEQIDFPEYASTMSDFVATTDGWFRATATFTVPEGVSMVRSFEISKVSGVWKNQTTAPDNEWEMLEIRKHRIELISDAVTEEVYTDEISLPVLGDNQEALEKTLDDIPLMENRISSLKTELSEVVEQIDLLKNVEKYEREKAALTDEVNKYNQKIKDIQANLKNIHTNPFRFTLCIRGKESGRVLDITGFKKDDNAQVYIYSRHGKPNQQWMVEQQSGGYVKLRSLNSNTWLAAGDGAQGRSLVIHGGDHASQYWKLKARGGGYYSLHNKAKGLVADVSGHKTKDGSKVHLWGYHGKGNQLWRLEPTGLPAPNFFALMNAYLMDMQKTSKVLAEKKRRLAALEKLLAGRANLNLDDLLKQKEALVAEIAKEETTLATKNNVFITELAKQGRSPQTMPLLKTDERSLKTYGARLEFARPLEGLDARETAEGNVQLSYFDTRGRMRFTHFDATADSRNAAFEQWLPDSLRACPDFRDEKDRMILDGNASVPLALNRWTVEAWFNYPGPVQADGSPRLYNALTSSADGSDYTIAIREGGRLGTVVNGFFHDSGYKMDEHLSHGWHHVAAVGQNGITRFYVNGSPAGDHETRGQGVGRYALVCDGNGDFVELPALDFDFTNGITIAAWVWFDAFNNWSRIIDFGKDGEGSENIVFANPGRDNALCLSIHRGNKRMEIRTEKILETGRWIHVAVAVDASGMAALYVDGKEEAYASMHLPAKVTRKKNYIAKSNWSHDSMFKGKISGLNIWTTARSAAEIQANMFDTFTGEEDGLAAFWPMNTTEVNGQKRLEDKTEKSPHHGELKGDPAIIVLEPQTTEGISVLGNSAKGGAPAGKLSDVRIWHTALSDEEIAANSKILITGNEPGISAYYPMKSAAGTAVKDHGPEDPKHGKLSGAGWAACSAPFGSPGRSVMEFDGKSSHIRCKGIRLDKRSFTLEFWAKRKRSDGYDYIMGQGSARKHKGLHIGFRTNNKFTVAFFANDLNSVDAYTDNGWHHWACVYDHNAKKRLLYRDGAVVSQQGNVAAYEGTGDLVIGNTGWGNDYFTGSLAEIRVWNHARSEDDIRRMYRHPLTGEEKGLLNYWPLNAMASGITEDRCPTSPVNGTVSNTRLLFCNDLPLLAGSSLVTCEYSTVGLQPDDASQKLAMMRRFLAFSDPAGDVQLYPGMRIEELVLKWIGNAQFEPTLLGYIEGAPPVPSENLTVNYDYDGASSVQFTQSDETMYSWMRTKDVNQGVDMNLFVGAGWGAAGGFGIVSKISEGRAGFRGTFNMREGVSKQSTIRASSTEVMSDRQELRGSYETQPAFEKIGSRYVPKNVGYALVVSGLADVFITQMKRTGRMIGYEVLPVEDIPPDINTITFMINPAYTLNGSLDGLVGSNAADERFYRQTPEMRAQYGSLYPSSYYRLTEAYDLKSQIERWDKERESYFVNFDATRTSADALKSQTADASEYDNYGQVTVEGSSSSDESAEEPSEEDVREGYIESAESQKKSSKSQAKEKKKEIEQRHSDQEKQVEASAAFDAWQRRMENLQIRAAKRNIVNTYVWDADGGMRSEEQNFANTVEHTVGGTFSLSGTAGGEVDVMVTGFKFELSALYATEMTQTMNKTLTSTKGFDLNVRLDGVERKGVTDARDYPLLPGEKVDRYRFMSFYLEGNTNHFHDFFNQVVDPEWLLSNDEEARALRQVMGGRPNKCWRILHRVTYVERPALLGFGRDLRKSTTADQAAEEVLNYFDALEQDNEALRADLSELKTQITQLAAKLDQLLKK